MERFKFLTKDKISRLPKNLGVYSFQKGREFLYIGKAANLKERVKNHFRQSSFKDSFFTNQVSKIGFIKTDSEIEALILEACLIKKYQPKYNVVWRDDKNFFYIGITKDAFARVFITHQLSLVSRISHLVSRKRKKSQNAHCSHTAKYQIPDTEYIGPFVEGSALKQTLRFLRKIFPYYTVKKHSKRLCGHCHLGLCPGPDPDLKEYKKNIENLISVLNGRKKSLLKNLKKEMVKASSIQDFEKAAKIRDQIRALEKVFSHTKILEKTGENKEWLNAQKFLQNFFKTKKKISRIESYDVSNIQGKMATGSMVVFLDGVADKNLYRKFKIKYANSARSAKASRDADPFDRLRVRPEQSRRTNTHIRIGKPNDIGMLKEILSRRLRHPEWPFPDFNFN